MNKTEEPKQYTQGWTDFYKLKFKLNRDVLIPRPETELLVDEVLRISKDQDQTSIFDIGTGSGCIAISIAKNTKNAKIFATDISEKALDVAKLNAKFHQVEKQVLFMQSDLLSTFSPSNRHSGKSDASRIPPNPDPGVAFSPSPRSSSGEAGQDEEKKKIDVIVTNLPYIPTARLMFIDPMVTEFEPKIALDGGSDGFDLYRKLLDQMKEFNIIPKYLIAEIDYEQGQIATQTVKTRFPNAEVEIKEDLSQKDRILFVKF